MTDTMGLLQCGQSSRTQVGGSNLGFSVEETFQKTLNLRSERSQVPPKHSKLSFDHFGGWLETSNLPPLLAAKQLLQSFGPGGRIQDVSFAPIGGKKIHLIEEE